MQAMYDLAITGGTVLDPAHKLYDQRDILIHDGMIQALIDPAQATPAAHEVIDARGQIVTPGLIDLHTHIFWGCTYWGVRPDPIAARSGVTTWVDAGSAGSYTIEGFRNWIAEPSQVRVSAFLNISAIGLVARTGEVADLDNVDPDLAIASALLYPDLICGIKARIDRQTTRSAGIEPLRRARTAADHLRLPLMVHIADGPPDLADILELLRPGDILTHCCTGAGNRLLDDTGVVWPQVRELQAAGVLLDVGHGTGSFAFDTAAALLQQGIVPDIISSDMHQLSAQGPMFDLPTTLTKFLALGMSLPDVIERATVRPGQAIGLRDAGTLRPGSPADIALWHLRDSPTQLFDVTMQGRLSQQRLECVATLCAGRRLPLSPPPSPAHWATLPSHQQTVLERTHPT